MDLRVGAYKPVCSGAQQNADGSLWWSDLQQLTDAAGGGHSADLICPQRFTAALAPNVAAVQEGRSVDDGLLTSGADRWKGRCDYLLIEGAGGLMCPLSDTCTVLDLATRLTVPILIVADNRLGVLNHTMLTVEAARKNGVIVSAIVLNNAAVSVDDVSQSSNATQLEHWIPHVPLLLSETGGADLVNAETGQPENDLVKYFCD